MSSMSNPAMPMPAGQGDPGDENDSQWQECQQDIESLKKRMSAVEAKLGIQSPADESEPDPLKSAIAMSKGPLGS